MSGHHYLVTKSVGNRQLVREVDRKRHRELAMVAVTALALAGGVLAYAWQHFEMIRIGYRMEELRLERDRLVEVGRQLELEKASLASPDRVEAIATRGLGMRFPTDRQIYVIDSEGESRLDEAGRSSGDQPRTDSSPVRAERRN